MSLKFSEEDKNNIFKNLYDLYKNQINCDLILNSSDNIDIQVHACVILARIPFISEHIYNKTVRKKCTIIKLEITEEILKLVLDYAYLNTCKIENNIQSIKIYDTSIYLKMCDIKEFTINYLKDNIDLYTAVDIFENKSSEEIKGIAKKHILKSLLNESDEYKELNIKNFEECLQDDKLNAPYEEAVWFAIITWIDYDKDNRLKFIPNLLYSIRLGMLPKYFIDEKIRSHSYMKEHIDILNEIEEEIENYLLIDPEQATKLPYSLQPRIPYTIILLTGGVISLGQNTNVTEVYDHLADHWIQVPELELPNKLSYHEMQIIDDNNTIYLIGGTPEKGKCFNSVYNLNINTEKLSWNKIRDLTYAKSHFLSTIFKNKIYVFGGRTSPNHRWIYTEIYDINNNIWTITDNLSFPRSDGAAVIVRDKIYLIGGYDGFMVLRTVEVYNEQMNVWIPTMPLNKPRSGLKCITYKDCIYAIGGWDGLKKLDCMEKFDAVTGEWMMLSSMQYARSNMSATCFNDKIYVFGGCAEDGSNLDIGEIYDILEDKWYPAIGFLTEKKSGCASIIINDIEFSSKILSTISDRSNPILFRDPNIDRAKYIIETERQNTALPTGQRMIVESNDDNAMLVPMPLPRFFYDSDSDWEFFTNSDDANSVNNENDIGFGL